MQRDASIPLDHPDLALVRCVQGRYSGPLDYGQVGTVLGQIKRERLIKPASRLFVSYRGHDDLRQSQDYARENSHTRVLYHVWGLSVVELPGVSEGTFLIEVQCAWSLRGTQMESMAVLRPIRIPLEWRQ